MLCSKVMITDASGDSRKTKRSTYPTENDNQADRLQNLSKLK